MKTYLEKTNGITYCTNRSRNSLRQSTKSRSLEKFRGKNTEKYVRIIRYVSRSKKSNFKKALE